MKTMLLTLKVLLEDKARWKENDPLATIDNKSYRARACESAILVDLCNFLMSSIEMFGVSCSGRISDRFRALV